MYIHVQTKDRLEASVINVTTETLSLSSNTKFQNPSFNQTTLFYSGYSLASFVTVGEDGNGLKLEKLSQWVLCIITSFSA